MFDRTRRDDSKSHSKEKNVQEQLRWFDIDEQRRKKEAKKIYNKDTVIKIVWLGQQIGVRVQKKDRVYRKTEYVIEVAFQIIGKE